MSSNTNARISNLTQNSSAASTKATENSANVPEFEANSANIGNGSKTFGAAPPPSSRQVANMIQRLPNSAARQQAFNQLRRTYGNKYCASLANQLQNKPATQSPAPAQISRCACEEQTPQEKEEQTTVQRSVENEAPPAALPDPKLAALGQKVQENALATKTAVTGLHGEKEQADAALLFGQQLAEQSGVANEQELNKLGFPATNKTALDPLAEQLDGTVSSEPLTFQLTNQISEEGSELVLDEGEQAETGGLSNPALWSSLGTVADSNGGEAYKKVADGLTLTQKSEQKLPQKRLSTLVLESIDADGQAQSLETHLDKGASTNRAKGKTQLKAGLQQLKEQVSLKVADIKQAHELNLQLNQSKKELKLSVNDFRLKNQHASPPMSQEALARQGVVAPSSISADQTVTPIQRSVSPEQSNKHSDKDPDRPIWDLIGDWYHASKDNPKDPNLIKMPGLDTPITASSAMGVIVNGLAFGATGNKGTGKIINKPVASPGLPSAIKSDDLNDSIFGSGQGYLGKAVGADGRMGPPKPVVTTNGKGEEKETKDVKNVNDPNRFDSTTYKAYNGNTITIETNTAYDPNASKGNKDGLTSNNNTSTRTTNGTNSSQSYENNKDEYKEYKGNNNGKVEIWTNGGQFGPTPNETKSYSGNNVIFNDTSTKTFVDKNRVVQDESTKKYGQYSQTEDERSWKKQIYGPPNATNFFVADLEQEESGKSNTKTTKQSYYTENSLNTTSLNTTNRVEQKWTNSGLLGTKNETVTENSYSRGTVKNGQLIYGRDGLLPSQNTTTTTTTSKSGLDWSGSKTAINDNTNLLNLGTNKSYTGQAFLGKTNSKSVSTTWGKSADSNPDFKPVNAITLLNNTSTTNDASGNNTISYGNPYSSLTSGDYNMQINGGTLHVGSHNNTVTNRGAEVSDNEKWIYGTGNAGKRSTQLWGGSDEPLNVTNSLMYEDGLGLTGTTNYKIYGGLDGFGFSGESHLIGGVYGSMTDMINAKLGNATFKGSLSASGLAGGDLSAGAGLNFNRQQFAGSLNANAFLGARADLNGSMALGYGGHNFLSVGAGGNASLGIGLGAGANASFDRRNGSFSIGANGSIAAGLGLGLNMQLGVNPMEGMAAAGMLISDGYDFVTGEDKVKAKEKTDENDRYLRMAQQIQMQIEYENAQARGDAGKAQRPTVCQAEAPKIDHRLNGVEAYKNAMNNYIRPRIQVLPEGKLLVTSAISQERLVLDPFVEQSGQQANNLWDKAVSFGQDKFNAIKYQSNLTRAALDAFGPQVSDEVVALVMNKSQELQSLSETNAYRSSPEFATKYQGFVQAADGLYAPQLIAKKLQTHQDLSVNEIQAIMSWNAQIRADAHDFVNKHQIQVQQTNETGDNMVKILKENEMLFDQNGHIMVMQTNQDVAKLQTNATSSLKTAQLAQQGIAAAGSNKVNQVSAQVSSAQNNNSSSASTGSAASSPLQALLDILLGKLNTARNVASSTTSSAANLSQQTNQISSQAVNNGQQTVSNLNNKILTAKADVSAANQTATQQLLQSRQLVQNNVQNSTSFIEDANSKITQSTRTLKDWMATKQTEATTTGNLLLDSEKSTKQTFGASWQSVLEASNKAEASVKINWTTTKEGAQAVVDNLSNKTTKLTQIAAKAKNGQIPQINSLADGEVALIAATTPQEKKNLTQTVAKMEAQEQLAQLEITNKAQFATSSGGKRVDDILGKTNYEMDALTKMNLELMSSLDKNQCSASADVSAGAGIQRSLDDAISKPATIQRSPENKADLTAQAREVQQQVAANTQQAQQVAEQAQAQSDAVMNQTKQDMGQLLPQFQNLSNSIRNDLNTTVSQTRETTSASTAKFSQLADQSNQQLTALEGQVKQQSNELKQSGKQATTQIGEKGKVAQTLAQTKTSEVKQQATIADQQSTQSLGTLQQQLATTQNQLTADFNQMQEAATQTKTSIKDQQQAVQQKNQATQEVITQQKQIILEQHKNAQEKNQQHSKQLEQSAQEANHIIQEQEEQINQQTIVVKQETSSLASQIKSV